MKSLFYVPSALRALSCMVLTSCNSPQNFFPTRKMFHRGLLSPLLRDKFLILLSRLKLVNLWGGFLFYGRIFEPFFAFCLWMCPVSWEHPTPLSIRIQDICHLATSYPVSSVVIPVSQRTSETNPLPNDLFVPKRLLKTLTASISIRSFLSVRLFVTISTKARMIPHLSCISLGFGRSNFNTMTFLHLSVRSVSPNHQL